MFQFNSLSCGVIIKNNDLFSLHIEYVWILIIIFTNLYLCIFFKNSCAKNFNLLKMLLPPQATEDDFLFFI